MGQSTPQPTRSSPYQLFMLGLSIYVIASLGVQTVLALDPETIKILDISDTAICGVFFLDFLWSLLRSESRGKYLLRWGWLDLLSSVPTIDWFRWGRAARVFRIVRVLRGVRATRVLSSFVLERRAESAFWAASLIAILITIFGSIGVLHLERHAGGNISTAVDALWWSLVTMTTVGYGDQYPVTHFGRIVAVALMASGIGLFGTFTAYVASAFMSPGEAEQERELVALREEISELRKEIRGMRTGMEEAGKDPEPRPGTLPDQAQTPLATAPSNRRAATSQ